MAQIKQHWRPEEDTWLQSQHGKGRHPIDYWPEFATRFGYSRTLESVISRLKRIGCADYSTHLTESATLQRAVTRKSRSGRIATSKLENFATHIADVGAMFKYADLKQDDVFRLVVQSDTHVPDHDAHAVATMCKFMDYYKPHGLINIGDFMEMESVSHWAPKTAGVRRIVPELETASNVLNDVESAAGKQCKFKRFFIGNHEDWLDQYFVLKIPEFFDGMKEYGVDIRIQNLLRLKKRGYRIIPFNEILRIGKAHFIHGYYTTKYHAQKHLDVFGCNIYYGHTHDVQMATNVSVNGLHQSASMGCLRDLNARFLKGKPNNWTHAFGVFEFRYNGSFTPLIPIIYDHKFSYNGIMFDGKTREV